MGRKELKQRFTEITGMPAKKVFAAVVCLELGDRRMISTVDWAWATENIKPEYRISEINARLLSGTDAREQEQRKTIEELSARCQELEKLLSKLEAPISEIPSPPQTEVEQIAQSVMLLPETIAIAVLHSAFEESTDIKTLYRQLAQYLHPDVAVDKAKSQIIFNHLKDTYDQQRQQREEYSSRGARFVTTTVSDEKQKPGYDWGRYDPDEDDISF